MNIQPDRSVQRPYLRLHSFDVYVRDQERSLRFYLDVLGFELAFDAQLQKSQRWVAVSPPDGTAILTLIQPAAGSPAYSLIGGPTHAVFVTDDIMRSYRDWSRRGVRFQFTPRLRRIKYQNQAGPVWGEIFTRFEDIDGNIFVLLSLDEVSKAIEMQRSANLKRQEEERRLAHELEIARQVQARLFPQTFPELSSIEYAGICSQARHVGGDYYDFVPLGPGKLGLVIADVAGKGIGAALLMANLQAHLRASCAMGSGDTGRLLRSVNRLFCDNTGPSTYATLFFGEYDDTSRTLHYANCGHLCGLVLRKHGSVVRLHSTTTVLGMFTDWECALAECRMSEGDLLLLYTDGVTEAFNHADEEFGEERLLESLSAARQACPSGIVEAVLADVRRFHADEQHDDITLMVAACR